jgi:hypothetical protein
MLDRMKRVVVESYVGAIALGYLLAQVIMHLVGIFASPVAAWLGRKEVREFVPNHAPVTGFSLQDALPELIRFSLLLLLWYVLLRWLYFNPLQEKPSEPAPNSE